MNPRLHRAVRAVEVAVVVVLGLFAFVTWRELSTLREMPVALPSYQFEQLAPSGDGDVVVRTRGTWVADKGPPEPLQTATIECRKSRMECVESTAAVVFVGERGLMEASQNVFAVQVWNQKEIVSRPAAARCGQRTLVLDLQEQRARSEIKPTDDDARCADVQARMLELVTGYKVRGESSPDAKRS
jgi:hypothetical protein